MTIHCLGALYPLLRIPPRSRWRKFEPLANPLALPSELWSEIFRVLDDDAALVAVSRVSRAFNAHAIPIYLARHGISTADLNSGTLRIPMNQDVFGVLQTAFFLPPVRKLDCHVFGQRRFQIIRYLALLLSRQTTLEDVQLSFYATDAFSGFGPKRKELPRRTVQREICRLLNCITPTGKALVITGDRILISGSAHGDAWRMVRPLVAPPRGIRAKARSAALAVKERKPARLDLVLNTLGEIRGTTLRDSLILDQLHYVHVTYAASPGQWAVVVLKGYCVERLNLIPSLTVADWLHVLPLLNLSGLQEFNMGRAAVDSAPELHDISMAELDAFLIRHTTIERLEYFPQLPIPLSPSRNFPLTHFLHLHHAPNSFRILVQLNLFAPASTPVARATAEFTELLKLLVGTNRVEGPGVCLCFPGAWLTPLPAGLSIQCVTSLVIFGDFALDVAAIAEFLSPFEPGLRRVEFQPARRRTFEHLHLADELRRMVVWLQEVSCVRGGSKIRTMADPKTYKTISITYDD
ncbi:hypothetical protein B0H13DRAFT_2084636 [Mycena leptocephala]|nr:hypothetical protein B0H13DRAFT_2084636 [Mycena leptocephala]